MILSLDNASSEPNLESVVMPAYDSTTALIVVDVQNDFADPAGSLYVKKGEQVVALINDEIARAVAAGARVGARSRISEGAFVGERAEIGEDSVLHPNVTVADGCVIGSRCILHPGVVVGSDGFGYVWDGKSHRKIPQVGTVRIGDDVEIGANSAIDRATLGETRIGRGTKIDNLVQIGHNVVVGEDVILCGQVGIAGSARSWLANTGSSR